jgi:hypothetical protein
MLAAPCRPRGTFETARSTLYSKSTDLEFSFLGDSRGAVDELYGVLPKNDCRHPSSPYNVVDCGRVFHDSAYECLGDSEARCRLDVVGWTCGRGARERSYRGQGFGRNRRARPGRGRAGDELGDAVPLPFGVLGGRHRESRAVLRT